MIDRLRTIPGPLRALAAVACGIAAGLAFAPVGWWPLVFVGVAGLTLVVAAAKRVAGVAALGLCFGLGLSATTLNWMRAIFVEAMIAIVIAVALFYIVLALALRLARRSPAWPLIGAGCWTVLEFTISRWPFDGFGWVRLGFAMVDSPLAGGYPLVGVAGVSFLTALCGQALAWVADDGWRRLLPAAGVLVGALALCGAGFLVPVGQEIPAPGGDSARERVTVGWVQGGAPGGGVYGLGPPRTITKNETAGTKELAAQVAAREQPQPDFVVWPEEGTDLDPGADAETLAMVQESLAAIGAPILIGSVLNGPGPDERRTSSQWWAPGQGATATYIKRGIVPFGEWVPYRDFLLPLVPALVYVGAQSVPGTQPGVLDVALPDGRALKLGVLVCFDVAFDEYAYDTAKHGAQVVVVQSSNAMYQGTGQIEQQFAMTRVRAAELRRDILVVTTSGVSGYIAPNGTVAWRAAESKTAVGVQTMPLRLGITPATWLAQPVELALVVLTLVGLVVAAFRRLGGTIKEGRKPAKSRKGRDA